MGSEEIDGVRVKCQSKLLWHFTLTPFFLWDTYNMRELARQSLVPGRRDR